MKSSHVVVLFIGLMWMSLFMKGNFNVRTRSTKGTILNTNNLEIFSEDIKVIFRTEI